MEVMHGLSIQTGRPALSPMFTVCRSLPD